MSAPSDHPQEWRYCHLLVGCPASGKSTLAERLVACGWAQHIVSTDGIRAQLYGDPGIQGSWREIERMALEQIGAALEQGIPVVYDATNARRGWRLALFEQLRRLGSENDPWHWLAWQLTTPIETCLQWNLQRERQVPEGVIREMATALLQDPPSASEGWLAVLPVDVSGPDQGDYVLTTQLQQLPRLVSRQWEPVLTWQLHRYSQLVDFERLLFLLSLLLRYPGLGSLAQTEPEVLRELWGGDPPLWQDSLEEIAGVISRRHGEVYGDPVALAEDLAWCQAVGLLGDQAVSLRHPIPYVPLSQAVTMLPHAYGDWPDFCRLINLLRLIIHIPFAYEPEGSQALLDVLASTGSAVTQEQIQADIEIILKPYQLLPRQSHQRGYFSYTGILSRSDLLRLFNILQSVIKTLEDPQDIALYERFRQRLQMSQMIPEDPYPTRRIINTSIVDVDRSALGTLAHPTGLKEVEDAILGRRLLKVSRRPGKGSFAQDKMGSFTLWPLQMVFHNLAWYLGCEMAEGDRQGLLRFERLDRLCLQGRTYESRDPADHQRAVQNLTRLQEASPGIFLGNDPQLQQQFLGLAKGSAEVAVELWFNETIFRFIIEGTRRFSSQQMTRMPGHLLQPSQMFSLPGTEDPDFPYRFRAILPRWALEDVDFRRWIIGFGGQVKVIAPAELVMAIAQMGRDVVRVYEAEGSLGGQ